MLLKWLRFKFRTTWLCLRFALMYLPPHCIVISLTMPQYTSIDPFYQSHIWKHNFTNCSNYTLWRKQFIITFLEELTITTLNDPSINNRNRIFLSKHFIYESPILKVIKMSGLISSQRSFLLRWYDVISISRRSVTSYHDFRPM